MSQSGMDVEKKLRHSSKTGKVKKKSLLQNTHEVHRVAKGGKVSPKEERLLMYLLELANLINERILARWSDLPLSSA